MKLVAVTSCPTGIAHTFMAAESLEQAALEAGHEILVETQGAAASTPLTQAQIDDADAVIFAADVEVRDRARFAGKPLVHVGVKRAISDPEGLFDEAAARIEAAKNAPAAPAAAAKPTAPPAPEGQSAGARVRGWLMTGVSYMIPFVAAGGILIALAFMIGGGEIAPKVNGGTFDGVTYPGVTDPTKLMEVAGIAGVLFKIGATAFSMLVPILAGFIAYGMAGRTGLVAGVVAGLLAGVIGGGLPRRLGRRPARRCDRSVAVENQGAPGGRRRHADRADPVGVQPRRRLPDAGRDRQADRRRPDRAHRLARRP